MLDNIDSVPSWLSDALCRAVTGEGYLRRALYTDAGISVVAFRRAIILTGIDPGATRGDLADRLLAIDLSQIDEADRQDESDVWYEDAVGAILAQIGRVDDATITEVVRLHGAYRPRADELTLARISRAREDAARQLAKTRDLTAWQATMGRLDAEEQIAKEPVETRRLSTPEIVDYTRSLPRLWCEAGPGGRQALVMAIFARLDVLGFQRLEYELTPAAIDLGLDAALPAVIELESKIGEFGRGERDSPSETQRTVPFLLINRTPPRQSAEQTA